MRDLLSDISHQLKTPLTSMTVMSELLENENLPPEKRQEFIEKQKKSLSSIEWMVLQLIKMAQKEALSNIVKNASEHTPNGGVIRMDCGENPLMFWISVTDSGRGRTAI